MNKYYYTLLIFFWSTTFSLGQTNNCSHPDYDALVAFNQALNGDNWFIKWDLNDCDVCNWFGVFCNQENRVTDIGFSENNGLKGQIPSSIQNLTELEGFVIIDNNLQSSIPSEIGNLLKLNVLNLTNSQIIGTIPSEIGNLSGLIALLLENNSLIGTIPPEIGNLLFIGSLNLSNNHLSGLLPIEFGAVGAVNNQSVIIDLSHNNFEGCIPSTFELFCDSPIPNKFYSVNLSNSPNLTNDDFIQFCSTQAGLCQENNTANCDTLNFKGSEGEITVSGLTPQSTIEIIGRNTNWKIIPICDGNCSETQIISDLMAGTYSIKVQLFGEDGSYCYREEKVIISDDGGGNTGGKANCDNLIFTTNNGQITIEGLTSTNNKVEIIGRNTDWQVLTVCDGNCKEMQIIPDLAKGEYAVKVNQSGNDGSYCYREEKVAVTGGVSNCDDLIFTGENGQIRVTGSTATYDKVEIIGRNTDWQVVTVCDGDCNNTQNISNLADGTYTVKVNQGDNNAYCYREEKVVVTNSSSNRNSKIDYSKELVLYPNPVRNRISLKFRKLIDEQTPFVNRLRTGGTGTIRIYNAFGKMIQSFPKTHFTDNGVSIDLNGYENGMYLLSVKTEGLPLITKRFVVEHLK